MLQIWTEKTTVSQMAKEKGLTWTLLTQWQDQAMAGMLAVLEPKNRQCPKPSPLSSRLQQLLEKKAVKAPEATPRSPTPTKRQEHPQKEQEKDAAAAT